MVTMQIDKLMSDDAILAELGTRLARRRIDLRLTQAELAHEAGISKRTVERIEAGASAQMASIIRICRVLDLLPGVDRFIPPAGPRPMELIKTKGKRRQRASSGGKGQGPDDRWTWEK
jgi:transcriptional regulator with XRE-family HTH domain